MLSQLCHLARDKTPRSIEIPFTDYLKNLKTTQVRDSSSLLLEVTGNDCSTSLDNKTCFKLRSSVQISYRTVSYLGLVSFFLRSLSL